MFSGAEEVGPKRTPADRERASRRATRQFRCEVARGEIDGVQSSASISWRIEMSTLVQYGSDAPTACLVAAARNVLYFDQARWPLTRSAARKRARPNAGRSVAARPMSRGHASGCASAGLADGSHWPRGADVEHAHVSRPSTRHIRQPSHLPQAGAAQGELRSRWRRAVVELLAVALEDPQRELVLGGGLEDRPSPMRSAPASSGGPARWRTDGGRSPWRDRGPRGCS